MAWVPPDCSANPPPAISTWMSVCDPGVPATQASGCLHVCRLPTLTSQYAALVVNPGNQQLCQVAPLGNLTTHTLQALNNSYVNQTTLPSCAPCCLRPGCHQAPLERGREGCSHAVFSTETWQMEGLCSVWYSIFCTRGARHCRVL